MRQAPPAGSRGSARRVGGALSLLPSHQPPGMPRQTRTHASHTSFSTAARGFAYKWNSHSPDGSGSWGGAWGRGGAIRGERGNPEVGGGVDGGQTVRVTWSSWMSCGMASRIWTAIFTTFRGGAIVYPRWGPLYFPDVQLPAEGTPGLRPLRTKVFLCPRLGSRGPHSQPRLPLPTRRRGLPKGARAEASSGLESRG